jgi:phosphoenolpyruvate-protein kinase (PTS system EI component)
VGVDELSMTKVATLEVKDALRRLSREACREAVELAIAKAADAAESRRLFL